MESWFPGFQIKNESTCSLPGRCPLAGQDFHNPIIHCITRSTGVHAIPDKHSVRQVFPMSDEQKADPIMKLAAIALMAMGAVALFVNVSTARSTKDPGVYSGVKYGLVLISLGLVLYRSRTKAVKKP